MRESLPTRLLQQLSHATPEQLVAIGGFLEGQAFPDCHLSPAPNQPPGISQFPPPAGGFKFAVEGDPTSGAFSIRIAPADGASQAASAESSEPDEQSRSIARKVFELLTTLDPDKRLRKAPLIKVFNLYYRQRLGPAEIARRCECDRSLIFDRLATIRKKVHWSPQQLQEISPHVEAMQEALTDSRAEGIYRKSAAYGDEDGDAEDA